jgi:PAS domain-containing protein
MLGASGALLTAPSAPATAPLSLNVDVSSPSMARPRPLSSGSATSKKNKDRMQHQAEECRRRTRLRERFNQLREAAECEKKDRFNILTVAIERIESNRERLRLTEAARDEAFRHLEALRAAVAAKAGPAALLPAPLHGLHGPAAQIAPNGAFLDCNLAFCGLLRVTRESVLAQSIVSIVPREEVRRMASALMRARAETSGAWNMHCSLIAHSGQPVPVSLAASREANGWLLLFSPIVDMAAGAETVTDEQLAQLKEGRI